MQVYFKSVFWLVFFLSLYLLILIKILIIKNLPPKRFSEFDRVSRKTCLAMWQFPWPNLKKFHDESLVTGIQWSSLFIFAILWQISLHFEYFPPDFENIRKFPFFSYIFLIFPDYFEIFWLFRFSMSLGTNPVWWNIKDTFAKFHDIAEKLHGWLKNIAKKQKFDFFNYF